MDKIIPKFRGIKAYEEELAAKSSAEDESDIKPEAQTRPPKRKIIDIDPKVKVESNEKRLKSLKEKIDFEKQQKIVVKEAINSGKRVNKRIVFDNEVDDKSKDNSVEEPKHKKAMNLFDSDSEDEEVSDRIEDKNKLMAEDFELDFDKKINNRNAEKLIELNSRFAHDSRFRIDDRFFDQKEDKEEEVDEIEVEKDKNLHILEEVLGKKLRPIIKSSDGKGKKSIKSSKPGLFVERFDPKSDKSSELELKSSSPEKKKLDKKVTFDQKVLEKEEEIEVSKEVYYEVSASLKDSLSQKEEEFSLTQLFGTSSAEDSTNKKTSHDKNVKPVYDKLDNSKRKTDKTPNPFRYDSSSDDEEEADDGVVVKTKSDTKVEDNSKPNLNGFKFFFDKNDPRFQEDVFWAKESVQKSRTNWKDRQIMIMRAMTVRKKSAKKNQKAKVKTFLKYKKNPSFKRFPKRDNKNDN